MKQFIPKDDQALPDSYKAKILYATGKTIDFVCASHKLNAETKILEIWDSENKMTWVCLDNVLSIGFDSDFTRVIEIREKARLKNVG